MTFTRGPGRTLNPAPGIGGGLGHAQTDPDAPGMTRMGTGARRKR